MPPLSTSERGHPCASAPRYDVSMLKNLAIAAVVLAASQSGGCGGGNTNPAPAAGPASCVFDLQFTGPTGGRFTASVTATCTVPIATSTLSLAIQHRPLGGGAMTYQNYDTPKESFQIPPVTLEATALCSPGEWEASASIDGVAVNGAPVNATSASSPITIANQPACNY